MTTRAISSFVVSTAALLLTSACGSKAQADQQAQAPPPPMVSVVEVHPENVPIFSEYQAQTFARDMVEVRGRVDGYIEQRLFKVGSDVKAGQALYVLDRRPYEAEVAKARGDVQQAEANLEYAKKQVSVLQANADLAQARANLGKANQDVTRLSPLVKEEAAPQQDLDNAKASVSANQAQVEARQAAVQQTTLSAKTQIDSVAAQLESTKASLRTAELNLGYATITSPVSGRIGDTLVPVGGLVSRNAATALTTVVPLDPIWVRFKLSEAEYLAYRGRDDRLVPLELVLADGKVFPQSGRIQNTVNQVDPRTGTLEVQATFPNPDHAILPGQFGRVRFRVSEKQQALLIPQRAVQELQGNQSVYTVGPDNKAQVRAIVPADRIGDRWIIAQGLKPGDRVIVEGTLKVRPGAPVTPQPYQKNTGAAK